jgi:hypothetical protein
MIIPLSILAISAAAKEKLPLERPWSFERELTVKKNYFRPVTCFSM